MLKTFALVCAGTALAIISYAAVSTYADLLKRPSLPELEKYTLTKTWDVGNQTEYEYSHVKTGEVSQVITEKSGFLVKGIFVPSKIGSLNLKQYSLIPPTQDEKKKAEGYPKEERPEHINLLCQQTIYAAEICYQVIER